MKKTPDSPVILGIALVFAILAGPVRTQAEDESKRIVIESVELKNNSANSLVNRYGVTYNDLRDFETLIHGVDAMIPVRRFQSSIRYADRETRAEIQGTTDQFSHLIPDENLEGRFLKESDLLHRQNIVVIGERVARDLFGNSPNHALGRNLRIEGAYYLVIGVVEGREMRQFERTVWIPLTTMNSRMGDLFIRQTRGSIEVDACQIHRVEFMLSKDHNPDTVAQRLRLLMQKNHERKDYLIRIDE